MKDYSKCDECKNMNKYKSNNEACIECALNFDTIDIGEETRTHITELNEFFQ